MGQSEKDKKKELITKIESYSNSFKTLGIEHDFNEEGTVEELESALMMAQAFFGNISTSIIDGRVEGLVNIPVTVEILSEFARDVSPEPEEIIRRIKELANQPEEDLDESDKFQTIGLFETYEALGEQSLIMTTSDWEPSEIVYLLNHMLKKLNKEIIEDVVVETIEEKLMDFEDDYEEQEEWVWHSIAKLLESKDLALIQMTPIGGIWSDKALIIINKEKVDYWTNKAFGGFALSTFSDDYLEI